MKSVFVTVIAVFATLSIAIAYPIVLHVEAEGHRCFRFNFPEDEDVDVVALVLPGEGEVAGEGGKTLETWYIEQVYALTLGKKAKFILPRELPESPPGDVAKLMSDYLAHTHTGSKTKTLVQISGTPTTNPHNFQHTYSAEYFQPLVVNYVGRTTNARMGVKENGGEGYGLCITNDDHEKEVHVIFDKVMISEEIGEIDGSGGRFGKDEHLTPLEASLDHSIEAANNVLREMKYMEKREGRMRKTAESINSRVRYFSYLSVSVLLAVTYIQVTYLKRYFHKKKLM